MRVFSIDRNLTFHRFQPYYLTKLQGATATAARQVPNCSVWSRPSDPSKTLRQGSDTIHDNISNGRVVNTSKHAPETITVACVVKTTKPIPCRGRPISLQESFL